MNDNELELRQIFAIFRYNLWVILGATILCAAAVCLVTVFLLTPMYTATASMYVYSDANRANEITSTELTTSQKLVNTYIVVLESDTVLDEVAHKLNEGLTAEAIRKMMTASAVNATEAFAINITHPDPAMAQLIVNTIVDIAPQEIIRVVRAGGVEVIDYAKLPEEPSSPNVAANTVVGALLGFVLCFGALILRVLFDTRIHGEEELTQNFDFPVLGIVPTLFETPVEEKNGKEETP